ncbi:MAG: alpha/beta fold hydrolase [Alphaproteobacteria bacterium]|nr:MAG: alpha/beta fold hydrolase [Alphaproteobacteria bacterium]
MFKKITAMFNAAVEPTRTALDYASLLLTWDKIKDRLPEGDGHPVLFLPGFLSDDGLMDRLRACVKSKGYHTYGWENGVNFGFDEKTARALKKRLHEIYRQNGRKKVSLVGHSLGGVYARELAREFPGMVRDVVTMGSPFGQLDDLDKGAVSVVRKVYDFFNPDTSPMNDQHMGKRCLTPPPVPTTSIYTKGDGVVDWRSSLNPRTELSENIRVDGGHIGIVFNPMAVTAVLDRLSQKEGHWMPFDRSDYKEMGFPKAELGTKLPPNPEFRHQKNKSMFKGRPGS